MEYLTRKVANLAAPGDIEIFGLSFANTVGRLYFLDQQFEPL